MTVADNDPAGRKSGDTPDDPAVGERQDSTSAGSGDRYGTILREAALRLADTLAPYGVLARAELGELSGASRWETVDFEVALRWGVDHEYLRRVGDDAYEVGPEAGQDDSTRVVIEGGW